jgi:hypothetical protein
MIDSANNRMLLPFPMSFCHRINYDYLACGATRAAAIVVGLAHFPLSKSPTSSVSITDGVCLACFLFNGHIMTFSLPSLKPLYDEDYLPLPDIR